MLVELFAATMMIIAGLLFLAVVGVVGVNVFWIMMYLSKRFVVKEKVLGFLFAPANWAMRHME